jgi:hypothetical protein
MIASFLIAAMLQTVVPGAPRSVDEIGPRSWCLETGTCPPPDDGFSRPAPGLMFLAVGMVGLGVAIWRADRRRNAPTDVLED